MLIVPAGSVITMVDSRPIEVRPEKQWTWSGLWWLVALAPFLILVFTLGRGLGGGQADDHGQYLMHARALAEGRPYTDIGYIYTPLNHWLGPAAAPPGLPLALLPILLVFGQNHLAIQLFMLAFAVGFLLLVGLYFSRTENRLLGIGLVLMLSVSWSVVQQASWVLTDLPFCALLWVVFFLIDRATRWGFQHVALVTAVGGFAVLVRPLGIALVPALLLYTLLNYKKHGITPALPVVFWIGGLVIGSLVVDLQVASVIALDPTRVIRWLEGTNWGWNHIMFYRLSAFYGHLYPFPFDRANDAFHVVSISLMCVGLAEWVRRSYRTLLFAFAIGYGAVLFIIPAHDHRYLWPLYPLIVFGLLNGIRMAAAWLGRRLQFRARGEAVALAAAAAIALPHAAQVPLQHEHRDKTHAIGMEELYQRIRTMAAHEPMRVMFRKPRSFAWETGVPAMGPFKVSPDSAILELRRKGITHVIIDAGGDRMTYLPKQKPEDFRLEAQVGGYLVYRFLDACECSHQPVNARRNCCLVNQRVRQ